MTTRTPHDDAAGARSRFLLRVEFDDELFLNRKTDVLALRHVIDRAAELLGIQLEPARNAATRSRFDGLADLFVLAALFANLDGVALSHLVRRDVDFFSVDLDVSVADERARLRAGGSEAEGVDDVVEPKLELAKKILAGDAGALLRASEVRAELALQKSVDALDLLLLAKLNAIAENLGTPAAVLAGGVITALDGALVLETAIALQEELHSLSTAKPANGVGVTSHLSSWCSHPLHHGAGANTRRTSGSLHRPRLPALPSRGNEALLEGRSLFQGQVRHRAP